MTPMTHKCYCLDRNHAPATNLNAALLASMAGKARLLTRMKQFASGKPITAAVNS
jgi:hypothetical protein